MYVDEKMQSFKVKVDSNEVMLKRLFLHSHEGLKASGYVQDHCVPNYGLKWQ